MSYLIVKTLQILAIGGCSDLWVLPLNWAKVALCDIVMLEVVRGGSFGAADAPDAVLFKLATFLHMYSCTI